ncbi:2-C-methyl-D-erythritol 2,4-cyclodiphosphate synthase [Erysipelotrichaceae bacterium OttesenSCG-928-M19]|nr:2-C-methyl-D-erythritol 2,4-cyclodiphosphate synthase [Erysipelotrichaceae bacterium OttesenSCG-928-M19]
MSKLRIGQSTDIHQLVEGLPLILGGINIESTKGCVAHSDGDALVHAITESIIGALALGDLGDFFSDSDIKNKNRSSLEMLEEIGLVMRKEGYRVVNIDSLIVIEEPKISPFKESMRKKIAKSLQIDYNIINIKATRGEKVGFIGRGEGVMAQAITLLEYDEK